MSFDAPPGDLNVRLEVFANDDVVLCETFNRPFGGSVVDGGFRVSGSTPFASGCRNAHWIGHTAVIEALLEAGADPDMAQSTGRTALIGAVVGTQPFGGRGLSGTGPKAGVYGYYRFKRHDFSLKNRRQQMRFPSGEKKGPPS